MRRTVSIIVAVVGALIVVAIILPFLIPVNQFRPTIEEKASAALGRKVALGNLSFSLIGGSLSAENLSIAEDGKFGQAQFFTAKSLKVGVELLPLIFSRKLSVTGVTINNPQLTLLHDASGRWNFSSLGAASGKSEPKPAPGTTVPNSGAGDFAVNRLELKDGRVIVGSTGSSKRSTYDHVDINVSDFSMTSVFPVVVSVDLPGGGKFSLDGKAGPVAQTDAQLTPLDAKLKVSGLNLASTGFLNPSAGLGGLLDLDATVRSQNGAAETKGNAKLSKALLVAGGSPASTPLTVDLSTSYNLRNNTGVLNPSTLKIGNAAAHLHGTYQTAGDNTVLKIIVDGQNMPAKDLQAFLPALGINLPKGSGLSSGTLNTNLNLAGPTHAVVTTGTVGLFGAVLTGFDLGSRMSSVASLAGIHTGKDLQIEKFTTNLRMAPDGLKADDVLAVLPAIGTITGAGTVDSKNNLDFKMVAVLTKSESGGNAVPVSAGVKSGCKGTPVPFLIEGTTAEPKFVPDVKGLAAGMVKSKLGCAPGVSSVTSTAKQAVPKSLGGVTGLFGKKKK